MNPGCAVARGLQRWQREALHELFAGLLMPRVHFRSVVLINSPGAEPQYEMYADHESAVSLCQDFVKAFFAGVSAGAKYTAEQCGQVARAASSSRVACAIPATKRGT